MMTLSLIICSYCPSAAWLILQFCSNEAFPGVLKIIVMMMMPLMGVDRRSSGPFRKQLLPFLRHKLLLRVFLSKRKKIAIQGRTQTSNSDVSYPYLSPLPLH